MGFNIAIINLINNHAARARRYTHNLPVDGEIVLIEITLSI